MLVIFVNVLDMIFGQSGATCPCRWPWGGGSLLVALLGGVVSALVGLTFGLADDAVRSAALVAVLAVAFHAMCLRIRLVVVALDALRIWLLVLTLLAFAIDRSLLWAHHFHWLWYSLNGSFNRDGSILSNIFCPKFITLLLAIGDFIRIWNVLILDDFLCIIEATNSDTYHSADLGRANRDYCIFLRSHIFALPLLRTLLTWWALSLWTSWIVDPNLPGSANWLDVLDIVLRCSSCCTTFTHFLVLRARSWLDLRRVYSACSAKTNRLTLLLLLIGSPSTTDATGRSIGSFSIASLELHLSLHVMILQILLLHLVDCLRLLIHLASRLVADADALLKGVAQGYLRYLRYLVLVWALDLDVSLMNVDGLLSILREERVTNLSKLSASRVDVLATLYHGRRVSEISTLSEVASRIV